MAAPGWGGAVPETVRDALRPLATTPHRTLLFAGPDGSGRLAAARWFASLLNCVAERSEPCGACAACTSLAPDAEGGVLGPDYREVRPSATTRTGRAARRATIHIDQLVPRERGDADPLGPWLAAPPRARRRIGVVVDADAMTEDAANAFLKTLEEPPSWASIVLVAPGPEHLLATVASRCLVMRFPPGPPAAAPAAVGEAAAGLLDALDGDLAAALEALSRLRVEAGDDEAALGTLRERARGRSATFRIAVEEATEAAADALAAYAHRDLTLLRLVLRLRAERAGP